MTNGLSVILTTMLLVGSAVLFMTGILIGKVPVVKTAVALGVLGFLNFVVGGLVSVPVYFVVAVLVFGTAIATIQFYETA